ncbi:peptidoglycan editing factor PgeF [Nevskia soli]|uniref:peptidoglycan editing factor PgeF n=1 Tax=Nevskia soli TaxID=418856 RepID=UPI0004A6AE63|nr:peptidoglycan editing factor PgeF [Nevskia soli]
MSDPAAGSLDLLFPEWPAPARVRAACTTRLGGVSQGVYASLNLGRSGDDSAAVSENRRRVRQALGLPAEPCWIRQVHGVRAVQMPQAAPDPEADASFTFEPGVVCAVQAADCMPVLFCDRAGTVVAAAHAGWRGLAGGVLERTVAAMGVPPGQLLAWLGPAIGPEAFEVGEEVREAFVTADAAAAGAFRAGAVAGKHYADLFALARMRLAQVGVSQVSGGGLSTHADPARFYSYRRDGVTGRMAALIWLEPGAPS